MEVVAGEGRHGQLARVQVESASEKAGKYNDVALPTEAYGGL